MKLIKRLGKQKIKNKNGKDYNIQTGLFLCPFCNQKVLKRVGNGLRDKSCGCQNTSLINKGLYKNKIIYRIYDNIKTRCYNKKCDHYNSYGSRNITMCSDWFNNRKNFYNWAIQNGWKKGLQIDRINVNGNYEPNNCRFITNKENSRNKQNTKCSIKKISLIKMLLNCKINNKEIGKIVNVSQRTISHIKNKTQWY